MRIDLKLGGLGELLSTVEKITKSLERAERSSERMQRALRSASSDGERLSDAFERIARADARGGGAGGTLGSLLKLAGGGAGLGMLYRIMSSVEGIVRSARSGSPSGGTPPPWDVPMGPAPGNPQDMTAARMARRRRAKGLPLDEEDLNAIEYAEMVEKDWSDWESGAQREREWFEAFRSGRFSRGGARAGGAGGGGARPPAGAGAAGAGGAGGMGGALSGVVAALGSAVAVVAAVVAVVIVALVALAKGIEMAVNAVTQWSKFFWKSGADQRSAEQLRGAAAAAGLSPEQAAAIADRFGPMGAEQALPMIRQIAEMEDDRQARQVAKSLGLEDFLGLRDLSPETREKALSGQGWGFSRQDRQNVAEFNYSLEELKNTFVQFVVPVVTPAIKYLTVAMKVWSTVLTPIVWVARQLAAAFEWLWATLEGLLNLVGIGGRRAADDKFDRAVDRFDRAVTSAEGVFGGVANERARNAYPAAWGFYGNQQDMLNGRMRLGSFSV